MKIENIVRLFTLNSPTIAICLLIAPASKAGAVGATVPFTTYEAESGTLAGGATIRALSAPATSNASSPELEASGRKFVELNATSESVSWTNNTGQNINFIDLRYSVADSAGGGGSDTTLNLYVNGTLRQAIPLTSKQTWCYAGAGDSWNPMGQNPANGGAHVFYDEAHCWITGAAIAPGSNIMLRKDAANSAGFYWIDLIDLEAAPAAITQPANSLSIASYAATATPTYSGPLPASPVDCSTAIQNCINDAKAQGKTVWIPSGRFVFKAHLILDGVTMQGAGIWYSKLYRNLDLPSSGDKGEAMAVNNGSVVRNLFVDANATSRESSDGDWGGFNTNGDNWLVENVWVQHTSSGVWAQGNNGTVRNSRTLNTWGDGINLNNGNTGKSGNNLTAENNYVRGTGDDGLAINDDVTSNPMNTITLRNNTSVSVWWANGMRIAGGRNVLVENNLIRDPAKFPGMEIGIFNGADLNGAIVRNNTIIRGGGRALNLPWAALGVARDTNGSPYVRNVTVSGNTISESMENGIEIKSGTNIFLWNNAVSGFFAGSSTTASRAINVRAGSQGSSVLNFNTVSGLTGTQIAFVNYTNIADYKIGGAWNTGFTPADPLPAAWSSQDIGAVGASGNTSAENGTICAIGSGADIWDASDGFRYVYQSASGNCEIKALVTSLENTNPWAKAGVMIRESLNSNSANTMMGITPGNGVSFQWRATTGGGSSFSNVGGIVVPCWVRLQRSGNVFTASRSADGVNWTTVGSPQTIPMANNVYVGLAVTSHANGTRCSALFDSVATTGVSGATFFANDNYGGAVSQTLPVGNYTVSQLADLGMPNDWASSLRVSSGRTVIMYANDSFAGQSWTRIADTPVFSTLTPSANDAVTSVRVQ